MTELTDRRRRHPAEIGVQRIPVTGGFCWLCGFPAVTGEKLPGRRHRVRLLRQHHDELVFGEDANTERTFPRSKPDYRSGKR